MRSVLCMIVVLSWTSLCSADWLTAPSFYTHNPVTGERTHQFAKPPETPVPPAPSYQTSGMRHFRSSLQFGPSADHYHRVEQWGAPIQPYGEWRFPYRPYSVPYDQWGAPWAGFNAGWGNGVWGRPFRPVPGGGYQGGRPLVPPAPAPNSPGGGQNQGAAGTNLPPGIGQSPGTGQPPGMGQARPSRPFPGGGGYFPPGSIQPWQPNNPYPGTPYAEGEYRDTGSRPRLNDQQFYYQPSLPYQP